MLINKRLGFRRQAIAPRTQDLQRTYYHGTNSWEKARSITIDGIHARDVTLSKYKGKLRPVEGRVYLTTDLGLAVYYATDRTGLDYDDPDTGYVFVIDGIDLRKDIQIDEDTLGQMFEHPEIVPSWLFDLARKKLSRSQVRELEDAGHGLMDLETAAAVGKKLIPYLTELQHSELLDLSRQTDFIELQVPSGISATGVITPKECWEVSRLVVRRMRQNLSNFFKLATLRWRRGPRDIRR